MRTSSLVSYSSVAAMLMAAVFAVGAAAQAPQGPPPGGGGRGPRGGPRNFPAPTNLKVLPKDLTGQQVRDIMRNWAGYLGVECEECHTPDPVKKDDRGRPEMIFDDDSKPEKEMARIMYKMTEEMKTNYVAKVEAMDKMPEKAPELTCGTCHRGHEDPEEYVIPKRDREGPPQGAPAGMAMPMGK